MFDWDSATVKVTVPVHHTATTDRQEVEMPLATFARLLLTSIPEADSLNVTSHDLPLHYEPRPLPI